MRPLLLSLTLCLLVAAAPLWAQPRPGDPGAYIQAKQKATTTFLDRRRPVPERLEAARNLRYPDDKTFAALLRIGSDRTEPDAIREAALLKHRYDDAYLNAVLKILDDPRDGSEALDAALVADVSRRTTFVLPPPTRQRLQRTMRALLDDSRPLVRLNAYRTLVGWHDTLAIERIAESLRRGQGFPVPLPDAIELLDIDGPAKHAVTVRPYLGNADPRVKAQAARVLAVDPQSRPTVVELARNPKTPTEVRLHSLRALAREDGQFATYAVALVEDPREEPELRQFAMKTFAGRMNYNQVAPADQVRFAQAVAKLAGDQTLKSNDANQIRESARQLHEYLRKAFPEVRRFYGGP